MKMGDIKSVKVDNWGVFFLQKLQNFFNKTDYCDLTLQFNDNSQLKVHRLVLNACTDYFNVLENTCEMIEDVLIMPKDLQADVIVPIVNFMYTGTLEFETNMYDRLLKTARDMNMTVLLKLLEAHRKTTPLKPPPIVLNKQAGNRQTYGSLAKSTPVSDKQRRTYASSKTPNQHPQPSNKTIVKKQIPITYVNKTNIPEPVALVSRYSHSQTKTGPSRFEPPDESVLSYEPSFNPISYETKPLLIADNNTRDDEYEEQSDEENVTRQSTSTFEQLRKGYTNPNKRPATSSTLQSPPIKKMNLQEIKEYTEQHRKRKEIEQSEEYEDEPNEYESMDESNFNEDEDDDEPIVKKDKPTSKSYTTSNNSYNNKPQPVKQTQEKSTVVIKDSSGSVNHAKIISEVLKKYPHLVKNNKNIKLKIMQKNSPQQTSSNNTAKGDSVPIKITQNQQKQVVYSSKVGSKVAHQTPASSTPVAVKQPARIDSKTMHALIAKGPENTTGPWLCIKCGIDNRPISIPSYRSFYRHLVNTHKQKIDDRICDQCGVKSNKRNELYYHQYVDHKIKPPVNYKFPKCADCEYIALDQEDLDKHNTANHKSMKTRQRDIQHCIYCNKTFAKEILLYAHMRSIHKDRAREDGVMDFSDDEQTFQDEADKYIPNSDNLEQDNKIKVLSNIPMPSKMPFVIEPGAQTISQIGGKQGHTTLIEVQSPPNNSCKLEPSSEAEALSNVATGIATSLGLIDQSSADENQYHNDNNQIIPNQYIEEAMANVHGEYLADDKKISDSEQHVQQQSSHHIITKLVTEDGSELQLTESQKDEIMSQLQVQDGNLTENVVMVLNQDTLRNDNIIVDQNEASHGNSEQNIVVVYRQTEDEDNLNLDDQSVAAVSATENASSDTVSVPPITIVTDAMVAGQEIKIEEIDIKEEKADPMSQDGIEIPLNKPKIEVVENETKTDDSSIADVKLNESTEDEELKNIEKAVDEFNTEINDVIEQSATDNSDQRVAEKESKTNGKNEDSDKYKLLSALEDWTDDDEDMSDSKNTANDKSEDNADETEGGDDDKVVVYQHTTTAAGDNDDEDDDEVEDEEEENIKTEDDDTKENDEDADEDKNDTKKTTKGSGVEGNLVAIMDEWENESQPSDKEDAAKETPVVVGAKKTVTGSAAQSSSTLKSSKEKIKKADEDGNNEEKKLTTKKGATLATTTTTTLKSSNNEQKIKSLINDWGDDDDESEI